MDCTIRLPPRWLPAALLVLAWPVAAGGPQGFRLDPVHTRVLVAPDHAGYSTALGTVSGSTGLVACDPVDWCNPRVEVSARRERIALCEEDRRHREGTIPRPPRRPTARYPD